MAKKAQPSAGMRKAVKKAEKISNKVKDVGHGDGGEVRAATEHFSQDKSITKPVVEGTSNATGEIRSFPAKGKVRNFNKNMAKAESRATAFINASTEGKTYGGY
jgi:hypothetical protein